MTKKVTARVLEINDENIINQNNIIAKRSCINISVGLPLKLRTNLGMDDIDCACEVSRDKLYLFRKNISFQVISLFGSVITINQMDLNIFVKILTALVVIPATSFFMLSGVRNKVTTK